MKIVTLVGARPQVIKAAVVSRSLKSAGMTEILVHSGQHYDHCMSQVFFDQLSIPSPKVNLEIGSGTHAEQTGLTLMRFEKILEAESPDAVLVYGDTNTTLAGALAAAKLNLPLAHVEAGLRSFDQTMPEEVNRLLTDRISSWLFCPTETAVRNLEEEGVVGDVHWVGDVMYDAVLHFQPDDATTGAVLRRLGLEKGRYVVATIHRDFNTDDDARLRAILEGLLQCRDKVVLPLHPRTKERIHRFGLDSMLSDKSSIVVIEPMGYGEMMALQMSSRVVVTDSGGVQKEAFFHGIPCVTVRPSTEWGELVESGWNRLVPAVAESIVEAVAAAETPTGEKPLYFGHGDSGDKIASLLDSPCNPATQ